MKNFVGVDGCRAGWLAVLERGGVLEVQLWSNLSPLFERAWDCAMVDMPIGLKSCGEKRQCDQGARKLLGRQASSVFFAPSRAQVKATDYEAVRTQGVSLQSFYLFPKIRELDNWVCAQAQDWLHEAHPELAYRTRSETILSKKRSSEGRVQRQGILTNLDSPFRLEHWEGKFRRKQVALDDLLDAAMLLELARRPRRWVGGEERDPKGLLMEICY